MFIRYAANCYLKTDRRQYSHNCFAKLSSSSSSSFRSTTVLHSLHTHTHTRTHFPFIFLRPSTAFSLPASFAGLSPPRVACPAATQNYHSFPDNIRIISYPFAQSFLSLTFCDTFSPPSHVYTTHMLSSVLPLPLSLFPPSSTGH